MLEKFQPLRKKLRVEAHLRLLQEPTSHRELLFCESVYRFNELRNWLFHRRLRNAGEKKIENLRQKRAEKVFVFANGPSLTELDFKKLKNLVDRKEFDLIVVNSFASGAIEQHQIIPTAIVLCDPLHFPVSDDEPIPPQIRKDIEVINRYRVPVFARSQYVSRSKFVETIPFCGVFSPYRNNVSNLQKPLGYYGLTAFVALTAAIHIGYKEIYICGFDNSRFKGFEVDRENRKYFLDHHFYDPDVEKTKLFLHYDRFGMASHVLMDTARHFRFLEKIQQGKPNDVRIRNIALTTYTDAFERCFDIDIYKDA